MMKLYIKASKVSNESLVRRAIGILYQMDRFILDTTDNWYWLTYGVPDQEFSNETYHSALANYKDYAWLVSDDDVTFDVNMFRDFVFAFKTATSIKDYDSSDRQHLLNLADTLIKDAIESDPLDGYEVMNKLIDNYKIYKKLDGGVAVWRAMDNKYSDSQFAEKSFSITYDQVRGFAPISEDQAEGFKYGKIVHDALNK